MLRSLILISATLMLTACETDNQFGDAVHSNVEVAAIAPLATEVVTNGDALGSAKRTLAAQKRYEQGGVLDLVRPTQNTFFQGTGRAESKDGPK